MQTGEYKFNGIECIEINKPLMDGLYTSALYSMKDKYILEVLAPKTLMNTGGYDEYNEMNYNIGDSWAKDSNKTADEKWPLSCASYYIKVNGKQIGESGVISTSYRYEPKNILPTKDEEKIISEVVNPSNFNEEFDNVKILTSEENNNIRTSSPQSLKDIFNSEDIKETLSSLMDSFPSFDLDDPNYEDKYTKYEREQEHKEGGFFRKFRNSVTIPDYLENEPMVIPHLIFRGTSLLPINIKDFQLSFIFENFVRYYLTRINLQLPFGKYEQPIQVSSEQWSKFTDKIFIEGVIDIKAKKMLFLKKFLMVKRLFI